MSEPQSLNESETQTASSFHPSAALLSGFFFFFFLSLYRFLRLSPVISRSNGCEVTSCLVLSRASRRLQEQQLADSCERRWKHANKRGQRLELADCKCLEARTAAF